MKEHWVGDHLQVWGHSAPPLTLSEEALAPGMLLAAAAVAATSVSPPRPRYVLFYSRCLTGVGFMHMMMMMMQAAAVAFGRRGELMAVSTCGVVDDEGREHADQGGVCSRAASKELSSSLTCTCTRAANCPPKNRCCCPAV